MGHDDVAAINPVQLGQLVTQRVCGGLWIGPQGVGVDVGEGFCHSWARRMGVLVGVEFERLAVVGLLAPGIALHGGDIIALVSH